MLHPHAAMLRSPSSLRSLLHLSRRRLLPTNPRLPRPLNPRLPISPLSTRPRFLPSSTSSTPGGAGWATYDPLTDSLSASAALPSASDSEAPAVSDAWGVYDPVSGRIVKQGSPPPSSSTTVVEEEKDEDEKDDEEKEEEEEGEEAGELEDKDKGKRRARALGGNGQVRWSSVAAARRPAGKRGREKSSYVCSNCGEGDSQWWGICRHCSAVGTLVEYVAGSDGGGASPEWSHSHHIARSWIPQKAKEMVPQSLQEVNKGVDQAEWRIPLWGSFGMEVSRVLGGGIVPVWLMCISSMCYLANHQA